MYTGLRQADIYSWLWPRGRVRTCTNTSPIKSTPVADHSISRSTFPLSTLSISLPFNKIDIPYLREMEEYREMRLDNKLYRDIRDFKN